VWTNVLVGLGAPRPCVDDDIIDCYSYTLESVYCVMRLTLGCLHYLHDKAFLLH